MLSDVKTRSQRLAWLSVRVVPIAVVAFVVQNAQVFASGPRGF